MTSSTGSKCTSKQPPLKWEDLEESCTRLDEAHVRIESLDLSCMEAEDSGAPAPDLSYSSEDEDDEESLLTAEFAVALLTGAPPKSPIQHRLPASGFSPGQPKAYGPSILHGGTPSPSHEVVRHGEWNRHPFACTDGGRAEHGPFAPGSRTRMFALGDRSRTPWDSMDSTSSLALSTHSDFNCSSGLQSELSIESDSDLFSPLQKLRASASLGEPPRAASEKLHRLAVVNHGKWEDGSSDCSGTPSDSFFGSSPAEEEEGYRPGSGEYPSNKSSMKGRIGQSFKGASSGNSRRTSEGKAGGLHGGKGKRVVESSSSPGDRKKGQGAGKDREGKSRRSGDRKLAKGSSYPESLQHKRRDDGLVIPSIMAEIDPLWDLWEGKGDFSGSGERDESDSDSSTVKGPSGRGVTKMFAIFSKTKR